MSPKAIAENEPKSICRTITWENIRPGDHVVQFYRTDDFLVECLASYIANGLLEGERALIITTPVHRAALEHRLRMKKVDVTMSSVQAMYQVFDAADLLQQFMIGGRPDRTAFEASVGDIVRQATEDKRRVRAFGEMVALLWQADQREAAIEVEGFWNELGQKHRFSLLCAYPAESAGPKPGRPAMEHICQEHTCIIPAPT